MEDNLFGLIVRCNWGKAKALNNASGKIAVGLHMAFVLFGYVQVQNPPSWLKMMEAATLTCEWAPVFLQNPFEEISSQNMWKMCVDSVEFPFKYKQTEMSKATSPHIKPIISFFL